MVDGKGAAPVGSGAHSKRDWGKWRYYRTMVFPRHSDADLVACSTCARPCDSVGSERPLCAGCWEVEHRLDDYLRDGGYRAADKLIEALAGVSRDGPCGECGHLDPLSHLLGDPS